MNKHLRLFLFLTLLLTGAIFYFLYWLMTRTGEALVAADAAIVFLLALVFGLILAGIFFCILRIRMLGRLFYTWLVSQNRKPGSRGTKKGKPLAKPRYYFRIIEHRFEMRDAISTLAHAGVTRIAVDTDNSIITVGDQEELQKLQGYIREHLFYGSIVSWFNDETKTVKDTRALSTTLRLSVLKLSKQFHYPPLPYIIFHIVNKPSYSEEEIAQIRSLNEKVGAAEIYIWNGRELTDEEIVTGNIPDDGWLGKPPDWKKT